MKRTKPLDKFNFSVRKYHSKTKMVSIRLDEDLYEVAKANHINISLAVNVLLRGYLYIQNYDSACPVLGSSVINGSDLVVDVYLRDAIKI